MEEVQGVVNLHGLDTRLITRPAEATYRRCTQSECNRTEVGDGRHALEPPDAPSAVLAQEQMRQITEFAHDSDQLELNSAYGGRPYRWYQDIEVEQRYLGVGHMVVLGLDFACWIRAWVAYLEPHRSGISTAVRNGLCRVETARLPAEGHADAGYNLPLAFCLYFSWLGAPIFVSSWRCIPGRCADVPLANRCFGLLGDYCWDLGVRHWLAARGSASEFWIVFCGRQALSSPLKPKSRICVRNGRHSYVYCFD